MVNELKDSFWAELICAENASSNLLETLLTLYLNCSTRNYSNEISNLIAVNIDSLDIAKLVKTLPPNWSVHLLSHILTSQFKKLDREKINSKLALSLSKSKHSLSKQILYRALGGTKVMVKQSTKCVKCGFNISNNPFSLGITGLSHQKCK
jgi:Vacuolar sorting protein 39 domain 2